MRLRGRILIGIAFVLTAGIAGAEAFARFGPGLGTPPLYEPHPAMEYRLVAGQALWRFHNRFETNERHMRSPTLIGETRPVILVVDDSVPYGGSQLDQSELATALLTGPDRHVANLSAQSWGPANILAALRENTDLDPEAIVVVLNGDDLFDVPDFAPLDPALTPVRNPVMALEEAVTRYLPRYLPAWTGGATREGHPAAEDQEQGRADYRTLLAWLAARPETPSCVVLHPRLTEVRAGHSGTLQEMERLARQEGIRAVAAMPLYDAALAAGQSVFLDDIHLDASGQQVLAQAIRACLNGRARQEKQT